MTLGEAAHACGRSPAWLIDELGLPPQTRSTERIGRVLRANGLRMSDLRNLVVKAGAQQK
jgi:hypothetical protein